MEEKGLEPELGSLNKFHWAEWPALYLENLLLVGHPLQDQPGPELEVNEELEGWDRSILSQAWHHKVIEEGWVLRLWKEVCKQFPEVHKQSYDEIAKFLESCSRPATPR